MQQPAAQGPPNVNDLQIALNPVVRQLERLEDRMQREMEALRRDMEKFRDDLVTKDALKPELEAMKAQIKALEAEKANRVERFWMKVGPVATLAALLIPLIEFLTHYRIIGPP